MLTAGRMSPSVPSEQFTNPVELPRGKDECLPSSDSHTVKGFARVNLSGRPRCCKIPTSSDCGLVYMQTQHRGYNISMPVSIRRAT
jgi:hypothetical protein